MQQNQGMSGDKGRSDDTRRDIDRMKSEGGGSAMGGQQSAQNRAAGSTSAKGGSTAGRDSESRSRPGQGQTQGGQTGPQVGQQKAKTVQPFIKDVNYPASKDEVLRGARDANAPANIVDLIVLLDDDIDYESDDDVVVAISACTC